MSLVIFQRASSENERKKSRETQVKKSRDTQVKKSRETQVKKSRETQVKKSPDTSPPFPRSNPMKRGAVPVLAGGAYFSRGLPQGGATNVASVFNDILRNSGVHRRVSRRQLKLFYLRTVTE